MGSHRWSTREWVLCYLSAWSRLFWASSLTLGDFANLAAINIGYSCKLLQEDMELLIVNTTSKSETKRIIDDHMVTVSKASNSDNPPRFALIIDGASLTHALSSTIEDSFYKLGTSCIAVIACRVSPLQKSLIVKLVKNRQTTPPNSSASSSKCFPSSSPTRQITLAIGDGANDVSMIQAAHVGVGISGMEGLQAARSADIAIAQFRYLKRLLLVHGCWSYHRLVKLILYSFYKNITLYMTQFWVSIFVYPFSLLEKSRLNFASHRTMAHSLRCLMDSLVRLSTNHGFCLPSMSSSHLFRRWLLVSLIKCF